MRKEILLVVVLGFGLGLAITFGVWTANKTLTAQRSTNEATDQKNQASSTLAPTTNPSLIILKPEDDSLISTDKIVIEGTTEPKSQIAIIGEKDEQIISADDKGRFSATLSLTSGTNEITITAFAENNKAVSKTLNIVYSTSEI